MEKDYTEIGCVRFYKKPEASYEEAKRHTQPLMGDSFYKQWIELTNKFTKKELIKNTLYTSEIVGEKEGKHCLYEETEEIFKKILNHIYIYNRSTAPVRGVCTQEISKYIVKYFKNMDDIWKWMLEKNKNVERMEFSKIWELKKSRMNRR